MMDPRATTAGSLMPAYPWLYERDLDTSNIKKKLAVFKKLGAPYGEQEIAEAEVNLRTQAKQITDELTAQGVRAEPGLERKEIIAMIAYLQRIGIDISAKKSEGAAVE
jgi:cytochrome c oxidase cbb3-type subunit I/II